MSNKPTIAELKKELAELKKDIRNYKGIATVSLEKFHQVTVEITDLKKQLKKTKSDYERACSVARHLSQAVTRLVEDSHV